jgi:hypothetical protein
VVSLWQRISQLVKFSIRSIESPRLVILYVFTRFSTSRSLQQFVYAKSCTSRSPEQPREESRRGLEARLYTSGGGFDAGHFQRDVAYAECTTNHSLAKTNVK